MIQEDRTGCALACIAALTGNRYATVKKEATRLGIAVSDPKLWTDTRAMRQLLARFGLTAGKREENFTAWARLPARALLAIKWHREKNGPAWHWVVFARDHSTACVLDSKKSLRTHTRTDFGRIKPKWFIRIG